MPCESDSGQLPTHLRRAESMRFGLLVLGMAGLTLALAWPGFSGLVYHLDDLGHFHLPLRQFMASCFTNGDQPWWCPDLFCGYYLHGEGQVGLAHPLHHILYRLFRLSTGFLIETILPLPLAALGTYTLLQRHQLPKDAAALGALIFGFSGYLVYHFVHPNSTLVAAHIPWLLLAIDHLIHPSGARVRYRAAAIIATLTGSQLLLGHPQTVLYSLLIEASYILILRGGMPFRSRIGWSMLAKLLGLGLGAIQLLPTLDLTASSHRAELPREFAGVMSLHPANLHQVFLPRLFEARVFGPPETVAGLDIPAASSLYQGHAREYAIHNGAIIPLLLIALVLTWRATPDPRRFRLWCVCLAIMGLLLAFGNHTPLFEITSRLPGLRMFRVPARYILLTHLATAALSAIAFSSISRNWAAIPARRLVWIASPIAVAAFLLTPLGSRLVFSDVADVLADPQWPIFSLLLLTLLTLALFGFLKGYCHAGIALLLLTMVDLASQGAGHWWLVEPIAPDLAWYQAAAVNLRPRERIDIRPPHNGSSNLWIGNGQAMLRGYSALLPRTHLNPDHPITHRLASVRVIVADTIQEVPSPLPWARLVTRTELMGYDPIQQLESLDIERAALVETSLPLETGTPGRVQVLHRRPGTMTIRTQADGRQLLVIAERHHPGWVASANGRSLEVLRVNADFIGCVVPAGTELIHFQFEPASLRYGTRWTVLSAVLTLGLFINGCRRLRRSSKRRSTKPIDLAGRRADSPGRSSPSLPAGSRIQNSSRLDMTNQ